MEEFSIPKESKNILQKFTSVRNQDRIKNSVFLPLFDSTVLPPPEQKRQFCKTAPLHHKTVMEYSTS